MKSARLPRLRPLTVAGMMSGTSADGIDIATVRIRPRGPAGSLHLQLLAHQGFPFSKSLTAAVLVAQDAERTATAELARLHWRLGLAYAKAYEQMQAAHPLAVDLIGCHGQTIYHQGAPSLYAGERFRCTWQIGETAPLARAAGVPVISNFRANDMVLGGQGAPLVPLLDRTLYRDRRRTRVLQNIGGIGNLTVVPPAESDAPVIAFDTGPGNMVVDALTRRLFSKPFDRNGRIAARGRVLAPVLNNLLRDPFFTLAPPRSGGREQFGDGYTSALLRACRKHSSVDADAIATAAALTAHSIALALDRFLPPSSKNSSVDLVLSGGGAKNPTLVSMIDTLVSRPGVLVLSSDDPRLPSPLPVDAKEAAAFALLTYMSWHRRPGNVPTATGATEAVVLGQVTCA